MLDLHTHILPCVDDGSRSVAESLELLCLENMQHVDTVCLTPHFYPHRSDPERFFKKRDLTYEVFSRYLPISTPAIRLGAEFAYFSGISRTDIVYDFRIQGSDLLLVEMPFAQWTEEVISEILSLQEKPGIQVVLAHVDRYFKYVSSKNLMMLSENGVLFQFNADAILDLRHRRKIIRLLKKLPLFFLGSDCHNTSHRLPHIAGAREILESALGETYMEKMDALAKELMNGQSKISPV